MQPSSTLPAPPDTEALESVLTDLGLAPRDLAPLGSGGGAPNRLAAVAAGAQPAGDLSARIGEELGGELAEDGGLLLFVEGAPSERELAAWRDRLWPLLHVVAVYEHGSGGVRRRTLQGARDLAPETALSGALLFARRRIQVLRPEVTVEKFDLAAEGWNGAPGTAGYPHFRWMRRHVGVFAAAPPRARILDFGCGAGWVGIEAAKRCEDPQLCFFDPSPRMVRQAEQNAAAEGLGRFAGRTGFGEDPPFPGPGEAPFDLVLSSGVISFSPDRERWLDGLARTVRVGGSLVIGDLHPGSRGFRKRRRTRALLPVRELNASSREHVRSSLEARGFEHLRSGGYQLTWPVPQAMHLSETRLGGALTRPLLGVNRAGAAIDRALGSRLPDWFDSWVMHLRRRE